MLGVGAAPGTGFAWHWVAPGQGCLRSGLQSGQECARAELRSNRAALIRTSHPDRPAAFTRAWAQQARGQGWDPVALRPGSSSARAATRHKGRSWRPCRPGPCRRGTGPSWGRLLRPRPQQEPGRSGLGWAVVGPRPSWRVHCGGSGLRLGRAARTRPLWDRAVVGLGRCWVGPLWGRAAVGLGRCRAGPQLRPGWWAARQGPCGRRARQPWGRAAAGWAAVGRGRSAGTPSQ